MKLADGKKKQNEDGDSGKTEEETYEEPLERPVVTQFNLQICLSLDRSKTDIRQGEGDNMKGRAILPAVIRTGGRPV